jgi:SAM-dependent methyltransferase
MIWCCPRCRGELAEIDEGLACGVCAVNYQCFDGIPDLRLAGLSWVDQEKDKAEARQLIADTAGFSAEETVRYVFELHQEIDKAWREKRTRQILQASSRLVPEVQGWLSDCVSPEGVFLDVGCGAGQLLAAAAATQRNGIGIDVRLVWLLVAKRLIAAAGGTPFLAAAMAEALPFADGSIDAVVSLDVIEHVGNVEAYLREIDRVTAPGGRVAFGTPNRFSLTAEPHIGVWGVGWFPRRWQKGYVKLRSDLPYEFVHLLSAAEAQRLFRRYTHIKAKILVPEVSELEIAHFTPLKKSLARFYNHLVCWRILNSLFRRIGPFFRIVGRKEAISL